MGQTFMILIFLAYPNMLQYFLYGFECIDIDGESRLKIDLEVRCWSQIHYLFLFIVALPSLIAWGVGLPFVTFWLLNNNRNIITANSDKENEAAETYGFIYGGFKSEYYLWEATIILRKALLIIVCIFLDKYGSHT